MIEHENTLQEIQKEWHGSFSSYMIGFFSSLFFTLIAFGLVVFRPISNTIIVYFIASLAILQAIAQLLFFLHLGKESKPRWETLVFLFMALVVLIVIFGSLWIMFDLKYRVMPGMTMTLLLKR